MSTSTNAGKKFRVWNFTLSTSDTAITLNQNVNSVLIQCRTNIDLYIRQGSGDSDYFTIKAGSSLTLDINTVNLTPFALRAESGSPVVEIIGSYE